MVELNKIVWEQLEPLLQPHATVANGRELLWISWCWQILDHKGLTSYVSEADKAMVLMRAVSLMRVHRDYVFIMLGLGLELDEQAVFAELCSATGCKEKATMRWEQKRIMPELLDAYVEWSPFVSKYDPELAHEWGWSVEDFLEDLKKTLPPEDEEEGIYSLYPSCFHRELKEWEGIETQEEYHKWLALTREGWLHEWLEHDWTLPGPYQDLRGGVWLYFHARWENVEPFIRPHLCWGTEEEVEWYREMWRLLEDGGYAAYDIDIAEVLDTVFNLVHTYQCFCMLALDRPISLDRLAVLDELIDWGDAEESREKMKSDANELVSTLVHLLANAKGYRRVGRTGRLHLDEYQIFLQRAWASLPVTEKTPSLHYGSPSAWRFDNPPGADLKQFNQELFDQRMRRLRSWLESGVLPPLAQGI